jgi:hypothetical protein
MAGLPFYESLRTPHPVVVLSCSLGTKRFGCVRTRSGTKLGEMAFEQSIQHQAWLWMANEGVVHQGRPFVCMRVRPNSGSGLQIFNREAANVPQAMTMHYSLLLCDLTAYTCHIGRFRSFCRLKPPARRDHHYANNATDR